MRLLKLRPSILLWVFCVVASLASLTSCRRLSQHPIVTAAVKEVSTNPRVSGLLGEPVACSSAVTGRANEIDGIAAMQFEASGPKGRGTVVVEGKKLGDDWGVTLLELRPDDQSNPVLLTADLDSHTGTDTPQFDPNAAATFQPAAPPPGDIEIVLPPGP